MRADPDFPVSRTIFQLILGDPEAFPGKLGDIIHPGLPLLSLPWGLLPVGRAWKTFNEGVQEKSELDARTTSTDCFRQEGVTARLQAPS